VQKGAGSFLFWILVPLGVAVLVPAFERDRVRSLPLLIYLFAAATFVGNAAIYQKYFDYPALLICFLAVFGAGHYRPFAGRALLALYCAGFIAYAAGNPFR
jgi:predicted permease